MIFFWAVFWGAAGTLFSMALASRWGVVDRPGVLKIHDVPVPRLGGLGMALAWQIGGVYSADLSALLGCLFCVGVPCFDTLLGIARRLVTGRPILSGDRDHFYDQLARRWGDRKRAVRAAWQLAAILALTGQGVASLPPEGALTMTALAVAALGWISVEGGFLYPHGRAVRTKP